jgi:hypothetical protein
MMRITLRGTARRCLRLCAWRARGLAANTVFGAAQSIIFPATLLAVLSFTVAVSVHAQRPTPPKDWSVDTNGTGTVTATRRGGMMSSASVATLIGPYTLPAAGAPAWLTDLSDGDAALLGSLLPSENSATRDDMIDGRRTLSRAVTVRNTAGASRYVAYRMIVPTRADERVWVMRGVFGDAVTMVRALRGGFDALLPYVLEPPAALRAVAVVAAPKGPPTSFRGGATSPEPVSGSATTTTTTTRTGTDIFTGSNTELNPGPVVERSSADDIIAMASANAARAAAQSPVTTAPTTPTQPVSTVPISAEPPLTTSPPIDSRAGGATSTTSATRAGQYVLNLEFRSGGMGGVYKQVAYLLRADGVAIEAPDAPPDGFNEAAARRARPNDFSKWSRGAADSVIVVNTKGERDVWGPPVVGLPATPGQRLNLVYRAISSVSTPDMATSVVGVSDVYRFLPDGRYETDAAVLGTSNSGGGSTVGGASRSGGGTYELNGFVLTLRPTRGPVVRRVFFFGSERGAPQLDVVCIGGSVYYADTP